MKKSYILVFVFLLMLSGCNRNLSEKDKQSLWEKAQTQGEITRRSGTPFNLATDKDLAMSDAENRLSTGGGLLGKKANFSFLGEIIITSKPLYITKTSRAQLLVQISNTDAFVDLI